MSNLIVTPIDLSRGFTQVPNELVKRSDISATAKMILVYLIGRPPGWEIRLNELKKHFRETEHTIRKALNELRSIGVLSIEQARDKDNRFSKCVWSVFAGLMLSAVQPCGVSAHTGNPQHGVVACGETQPINTDPRNTDFKKTEATNNDSQPRAKKLTSNQTARERDEVNGATAMPEQPPTNAAVAEGLNRVQEKKTVGETIFEAFFPSSKSKPEQAPVQPTPSTTQPSMASLPQAAPIVTRHPQQPVSESLSPSSAQPPSPATASGPAPAGARHVSASTLPPRPVRSKPSEAASKQPALSPEAEAFLGSLRFGVTKLRSPGGTVCIPKCTQERNGKLQLLVDCEGVEGPVSLEAAMGYEMVG